ncbi:MAG: Tyrosine recombinase XerD [Alphaproteobacteria bacterium ADurb.Bin438]|nr:MAG: Tyrosine recombinase XerD [Alphaproteobacteria bacterium ADurb.Bin438]
MAKQPRLPYRIYKRGSVYYTYISIKTDDDERVQFRESTGTDNYDLALKYTINRIATFKKQEKQKNEITLDEAFGRYMLEVGQYQANPKWTISRFRNLLSFFDKDVLLSRITNKDILRYVEHNKNQGRSNATVNRYLSALVTVINRARDYWDMNTPDFKITHTKFKLKEPAENIKYFKDWEELQQVIDNAAEHLKPIIYTAIYTGLRINNILGLKWENINFKNKTITIKVKDKNVDGGKLHTLPIIDPLLKVLKNIEKISEYVFTYQYKPIKSIRRAWKSCFKDGMKYKSIHILRHTAATWILKKTGNLKITKEIMGHSKIETTLKYAHILDSEKRDALNDVFKDI